MKKVEKLLDDDQIRERVENEMAQKFMERGELDPDQIKNFEELDAYD